MNERLQEMLAQSGENKAAVKALIGRYPDLRDRVVAAFSTGPMKMANYDQWSGYIAPDTYHSGGLDRPNTSPIRLALVEILHEARERYAAESMGELPDVTW